MYVAHSRCAALCWPGVCRWPRLPGRFFSTSDNNPGLPESLWVSALTPRLWQELLAPWPSLRAAAQEEPGAVITSSPVWVRARSTAWEPQEASQRPGPAVPEVSPVVPPVSPPPCRGRVTDARHRQQCGTGDTRLCRAGSQKIAWHKLGLPRRDTETRRADSSSSKEGTD